MRSSDKRLQGEHMWIPAHERHAIERVSLTFELSGALPIKLLSNLMAGAASKLASKGLDSVTEAMELNFPPAIMQQGAFFASPQISVGPNGLVVGGQAQPFQASGRTYRLIRAGEVKEELQLHKNRVVYMAVEYDGWVGFRQRFLDLAGEFLERSITVAGIDAVKLEYWDRFTFDGNQENIDFLQLIRENSPYVADFARSQKGLWHSHIGFFTEPGSAEKRLVNLNVDVVDLAEAITQTGERLERRSVGIYSMVQDTFDRDHALETTEHAVSTTDEMHTILKDVLTNVITTEIAERISLNHQVDQ